MTQFTPANIRLGFACSCLSSRSAESAGVNVTALNTDNTTENAIVSENC